MKKYKILMEQRLVNKGINIRTSKLPKYLLEKGEIRFGLEIYNNKKQMERILKKREKESKELKYLFKESKKLPKQAQKTLRRELTHRIFYLNKWIRDLKKKIKNIRIIYFRAEDIEDFYRKLRKKKNESKILLC